jgi:hypothetical protein
MLFAIWACNRTHFPHSWASLFSDLDMSAPRARSVLRDKDHSVFCFSTMTASCCIFFSDLVFFFQSSRRSVFSASELWRNTTLVLPEKLAVMDMDIVTLGHQGTKEVLGLGRTPIRRDIIFFLIWMIWSSGPWPVNVTVYRCLIDEDLATTRHDTRAPQASKGGDVQQKEVSGV